MGRHYYSKKATIEDCHSINTVFLKKHGYLKSSSWRSGGITWSWGGQRMADVSFQVNTTDLYIRFLYKSRDRYTGEDWQDKDYRVRLTTTPCNLGGVRYWFICNFCSRRVGVLSLYDKNDFACRHCLNLSYNSRNSTKRYRPLARLFMCEEIEEQIWGLRTKYYRGIPTRRHKKLLIKAQYLGANGLADYKEIERQLLGR